MRPLKDAPVPLENGSAKQYSNYQEWRGDLAEAYGQHCVYCNDFLQGKLEVEHAVAQSLNVVPPLVWSNLYLACGPCNLAKSNKPIDPQTQYLPHLHNTHLVFDYEVRSHKKIDRKYACVPVPSAILNEAQKLKALESIKLAELDRVEQAPNRRRKMTDIRWSNRFTAYELCLTQRELWDILESANQKQVYFHTIPPLVHKTGFFSLWFKAFEDVPEVLEVIYKTFEAKNLCTTCFDEAFNPIPRNPANTSDPI